MVTICVDYQGPKNIQNYRFADFNDEYLAKLTELEQHDGKIDKILIYEGVESTKEVPGVFAQLGRTKHVDTTSVGIAVRKGRLLAKHKRPSN